MSGYIIWILILAIWNVILFYGHSLGVSVILFIAPLLTFIYMFLKNNKKINNKNGLLVMIPMILLSLTYLIFDNDTFSILNCLVITVLFGVLYVFVINPVNKISELIDQAVALLIVPLSYIGKFYRVATSKIASKIKLSDKSKKILKSCLIVLPIVIIVIALLSSADMIFGDLFDKIFGRIIDFIVDVVLDDFIGRLITFIIIFFLIGVSMMYILFEYPKKKEEKKIKENKIKDVLTFKILVSVLNIIYVIFDIIQIKSLMLHSVASNINYAEYARQGFFELMVVSIINIAVILISKKYESKDNKKEYKFINIMNVVMVFLTIIIIISSFMRMNLYEAAYGYTTLRLLVYITLMTETVLMIPTIMYILNSNINIFKCYLVIIMSSYIIANFINIDYIVARRNVNRYYMNEKIDFDYLRNYGYDNIPILIELYNRTDDYELKGEIKEYLEIMARDEEEKESIFEFNIARYKGKKLLEDFK